MAALDAIDHTRSGGATARSAKPKVKIHFFVSFSFARVPLPRDQRKKRRKTFPAFTRPAYPPWWSWSLGSVCISCATQKKRCGSFHAAGIRVCGLQRRSILFKAGLTGSRLAGALDWGLFVMISVFWLNDGERKIVRGVFPLARLHYMSVKEGKKGKKGRGRRRKKGNGSEATQTLASWLRGPGRGNDFFRSLRSANGTSTRTSVHNSWSAWLS